MAGWNLKKGSITEYNLSDDRIWSLFNFVFSDSSRKRNTYKFGLIKAIIDNIFNGKVLNTGVYFSYEEIFGKFAENYWNLVVKYDLRQMRKDGKSVYSKIETILREEVSINSILAVMRFDSIPKETKIRIINNVTAECKKCVVGALYEDFEGTIYDFDLKGAGITLNYSFYEFILKHKTELERLNYYAWAKFLEQINNDNVLIGVIGKLELATPRRENLSIYREMLRREFEENTCFYCGRKLQRVVHVDHFIPWSFVKDDKMWNLVLSCPTCNERKNNRVPSQDYLIRIEERNKKIQNIDNVLVQADFSEYTEELLRRIWYYAKLSGLKEYKNILEEEDC